MTKPSIFDEVMENRSAVTLNTGVWAAIGFAGSLGLALTGTRLGALPDPGHENWWFSVPASHYGLLRVLFYVSFLLVVSGWVGIGIQARRSRLTTGVACAIFCLWALPLLVGPPIFSKDLYSYIGQGLLAHRGLDPYSTGTSALGHGPLLSSIASVWRHSPTPYGPLFITTSRAVVSAFGPSLIAQTIALRCVELIGMALIAYSLPRLARHLGTDPGIALWLGVLSPLTLFSFVASGHNDCLMLGLLLAGVTMAVEGRLVGALLLCSLATAIKVPAAAGLVFIGVDQVRRASGRRRYFVLTEVLAIPIATVAVVILATGLGWKWLGPINLRVPSELRVLSTPSVSIGVFLSRLLHLVRIPGGQGKTITVVQSVLGGAGALAALWLLAKSRSKDLVHSLALVLLLVVLVGPTLWPWYLTWGLTLLAACPAQRSKALAVGAGLAMLVCGPSGSPMLNGYWYIPVALACAAGAVWLVRRRTWSRVVAGRFA